MTRINRLVFLCLGLGMLLSIPLYAAKTRHMNLETLTANAGMIFRGTLTAIVPGTIQAGGAELPTVTYKFIVTDSLKGTFQTAKNGIETVELTIVGSIKDDNRTVGNLRARSILPALPDWRVESDYVVFTTPESAIGLCVPVGLGQGSFRVFSQDKSEMVVNGINNAGLFQGMIGQANAPAQGPMTYSELATHVRNLLGGAQ